MEDNGKKRDSRLDSLRTIALLDGVDLPVRDVCENWLLLTYDLPNTEEGNKLRSEFLRTAKRMGAVQHTESVYLLPWTQQAELLAMEIAKIGNAFIWTSHPQDPGQAAEITEDYDNKIVEGILSDISDRLEKMEESAGLGNSRSFHRMVEKTEDMITEARIIARRRGSKHLINVIDAMEKRYREISISAVDDDFANMLKGFGT